MCSRTRVINFRVWRYNDDLSFLHNAGSGLFVRNARVNRGNASFRWLLLEAIGVQRYMTCGVATGSIVDVLLRYDSAHVYTLFISSPILDTMCYQLKIIMTHLYNRGYSGTMFVARDVYNVSFRCAL